MEELIVDAKTAIELLRDEDNYSASPEDADNDIWTTFDMTIENANAIADLIEQQEKQIKSMRKCENCKNGAWDFIYDMMMCKSFDECRESKFELWKWDGGE